MMARYTKAQKERFDEVALQERGQYRRMLQGKSSSWPTNFNKGWWKQTPERWAWLNETHFSLEEQGLQKLMEIDAFVVKHGREPKRAGPIEGEHVFTQWLVTIRSGAEVYPSMRAFKPKGLREDWHQKEDKEKKQLEVLKKVDAFVVKHGHEPRQNVKGDKRQEQLARWLSWLRQKQRIYPTVKRYKVKGLRSDWWKMMLRDSSSLDMLKKLEAFVVKHGREPRSYLGERPLYDWLHHIRTGERILYPSLKKHKVKGLTKDWWVKAT